MSLIGNPDTPQSYVADYMQACVGMFGIPAGGFTSDIETYGAASGYDVESLYAAMLNSSIGRAIYSPGASNEAFATALVGKLGGSLLADADKAAAIDEVQALLDGGLSQAATAMAVVEFVAALDTSDATYGAVAQQFQNRIEIANYYTFSSTNPSSTLSTLTAVLSGVSNTTDVSDPEDYLDSVTDPGVSTGQTFTLTTGLENTSAETVNGVIAANVAGGQTFQTGDQINGSETVNVTVAAANNATAADVNNVTNLNFTLLAGNEAINAALYDNVANVNVSGGSLGNSVLTVNNGALATTYGVLNDTGNNDGITVNIRAADLAGTADTLKFSVNNAGSVVTTAGLAPVSNVVNLTANSNGVEKVTVATAGTNNIALIDNPAAGVTTDYATLEITGNGTNTINASAFGQATTFDMSTSTGTNTLNLAGALASSTTIKGGTGADTLRVAQASTAANLTVTGVETLRLSTGSNTGMLQFTSAPNFTTVRVDGDTAEAGTYTLNNIGTLGTVSYVGDSLTANSATAQQFNNLTINTSLTGASDTLAVNIGNGGIVNTGGYTMRTLTAHGAETLNIAVSDAGAASTTTFTGIVDNALSSLTVTSAGAVALGNVNGATAAGTSGNLALLDLTGVTGTAASSVTLLTNTVGSATVIKGVTGTAGTTLTLGAEATTDSVIYTGGAGIDTLNGGNFTGTLIVDGKGGADVITGGSGADALTGGEGADTISGGAGADSIILTETVAAQDIVQFNIAANAADADTITGFGIANDVLQFDISALTLNAADFSAGAIGGVTVVTAAQALALATGAANNHIIVDTAANILTFTMVDEYAGAALAVATDTGEIYYDANADFTAGAIVIGTVTGGGAFTAANFQIVA